MPCIYKAQSKTVLLLSVFIIAFISSCDQLPTSGSIIAAADPLVKYTDQMGDIPYRSDLDDPTFLLCDATNVVHSRLSLTYEGGWSTILAECQRQFKSQPEFESFSGYVMIHFLINCNYELGRFRVSTMAMDFSPLSCPDHLSNQLLAIVQDLNKWQRTSRYADPVDCSKYLNFKIADGNIEAIIH